MWYRFSKQILASEADLDRETLDMTGGVSAPGDLKKAKMPPKVLEQQPAITQPVAPVPEPVVPEQQDLTPDIEEDLTQPSEKTFTDYTPDSSADKDEITDEQTAYRARDLSVVMQSAGVQLPMHEDCHCKIQFRPDDSSEHFLIPRWEVSNSACHDCLNAQRAFNSYVESTGVRVAAP